MTDESTCFNVVPGVPDGAEIDGGDITQLFNVDGAILHLRRLDLSRAATNSSGAAISASGGAFVSVSNCIFSTNSASEGAGGKTCLTR